jgi:hypothetical protein
MPRSAITRPRVISGYPLPDTSTGRKYRMATANQQPDREPESVAAATEYLAERGIPAGAREFRLRQEFFRHGWDIRVREENGGWTVHALKAERPEILIHASTEGNVLRLALMSALEADKTASG